MHACPSWAKHLLAVALVTTLAACGGADPAPTPLPAPVPEPPPAQPQPPVVSARLIAGSATAGAGSCDWIDGRGEAARFNGFTAMAVGPTGTVYIGEAAEGAYGDCAATTRSRIRSITPQGVVATVALNDVSVGPSSTSFSVPAGLATGPGGVLYVSNQAGVPPFVAGPPTWWYPAGRAAGVWRLQAGQPPLVLAGVAQAYLGGSLVDGIGAQAVFAYTEYLALDGGGNLYLRDEGARIRHIDPHTGVVSTLPGQLASALTASPNGTVYATSGTDEIRDLKSGEVLATGLPDRWRVAVDDAGSVYAATHTVVYRKRKTDAQFSELAGAVSVGDSLATPLHGIRAIAVSPTGGLYVFDRHALLHMAN